MKYSDTDTVRYILPYSKSEGFHELSLCAIGTFL